MAARRGWPTHIAAASAATRPVLRGLDARYDGRLGCNVGRLGCNVERLLLEQPRSCVACDQLALARILDIDSHDDGVASDQSEPDAHHERMALGRLELDDCPHRRPDRTPDPRNVAALAEVVENGEDVIVGAVPGRVLNHPPSLRAGVGAPGSAAMRLSRAWAGPLEVMFREVGSLCAGNVGAGWGHPLRGWC